MTSLQALTVFHTFISILALLVGVPALIGLWWQGQSRWVSRSFLVLAATTSLTGFLFPFAGITPGIVTSVVASMVLALILLAEFGLRFQGAGRWLYAVGIVVSEYLLVFVALVQAFHKLGFLQHLAPTQTPFIVAQLLALVFFVLIAIGAAVGFRPSIDRTAMTSRSSRPLALK